MILFQLHFHYGSLTYCVTKNVEISWNNLQDAAISSATLTVYVCGWLVRFIILIFEFHPSNFVSKELG